MIKQRNKHVRLIVTLLLITVVMASVPSVFAVTVMSQDVYDGFPNTESNGLTEADDGVLLDAIDSDEGVEFAEPPEMETEDAETLIAAGEIPELSEDEDVTLFAASATVASGVCGDNLTWTIDSNYTLTISGSGEIYDFEYQKTPWYSSYDGVLFNKDQTELLAYAKDKLEPSYKVPDGVKTIQQNAFQNCRYLTNVEFPNTIETLEWSSFCGCVELTRLEIPNSMKYVGHAFTDCSNLSNIIVDRAQNVIPFINDSAPNATATYLREIDISTSPDTEYTGKAITPVVSVSEKRKDGTASKVLVENEDYTLTYSNNVNAGPAAIAVNYINNYSNLDTDERVFTITPKTSVKLIITPISDKEYTSRAITPKPTVTDISR